LRAISHNCQESCRSKPFPLKTEHFKLETSPFPNSAPLARHSPSPAAADPHWNKFPIDVRQNQSHLVIRHMGEMVHSKCACKECGNNIEFPAYAARTTVPCPHCGQWTELLPPEALPEPKQVDAGVIALIACAVLVAIGAVWLHHRPKPVVDENAPPEVTHTKPATPVAKVAPVETPSNPPPPVAVTQTPTQVPAKPTRPKSLDDLKPGMVELQKTPGSTLVYAVGTVKNDSDWQRFGVKIELDLFNKKGDKLGSTQDYKDILEPRQDWQFHALIPDKHTASAKITSLKEQE
jgi:hypothetical protein